MSFLRSVYRKFMAKRASSKIWREHGNHTEFHLVGPQFDIAKGGGTHGVPKVHIYDDRTRLIVGKYCSIAAGVQIILGGNHHTRWVSTYGFYQELQWFPNWEQIGENSIHKGDVTIGNDVWIGRNALILSGTTIGDGAVIGAGAVVSGTIPPYAVAVGNPARVIKLRFKEEHIAELLQIRWWDWPHERINEALPAICSEDVEAFIAACKKAGYPGQKEPQSSL